MNDALTQGGASGAADAASKFRDWHGTLNCGFTGESCKLTVRGQYHLAGRCGGVTLEKRTTDFNPTLFTIDIVDGPGSGGDWVDLEGTFDAGKEVEYAIVQDAHGNSHKFRVHQLES